MSTGQNLELGLLDEERFANDAERLATAQAAAGALLLYILRPLSAGTCSEVTIRHVLDLLAPWGAGRALFYAACPAMDGYEGNCDAFANTIRSHCRKAIAAGRVKAVGERWTRAKAVGVDDLSGESAQ